VGVGEPVRELAADEQREVDRQPLLALAEQRERAPEVPALDVLEREKVLVADAPDLEHLSDVDVLELDRDLGFVDEPRDERRVRGQVREHLLDHRELLEPRQAVLREKDFPHPTARQALDEQVPAEHLRQARIDAAGRSGHVLRAFIGAGLQPGHPNATRATYNDHFGIRRDLFGDQHPVMIR